MTCAPPSSNRPQPAPPSWRLERLSAWHLPLLHDPAFLPLQPVLQRAVLLGLPERLLHRLTAAQPLAAEVLVAFQQGRPEGLIVSRRLNRSGTSWQVQHLRLAGATEARRQLAGTLLRGAIRSARQACSWIASASSLDNDRLAALREQGFQPMRTDQIWRWSLPLAPGQASDVAPPSDLLLQPLNRRTAPLLWQLEQAAAPALLRQLQDRRVEDLLDQSRNRGWLLIDPTRDQAVAAARWLAEHPGGGHDVELTLHPAWGHLLGAPTQLLLDRLRSSLQDPSGHLWLLGDVLDKPRQRWLEELGCDCRGERVLMARSVWHRQEQTDAASQAARRLEAMLGQLQPRRRPLPTPVAPR